MADDNGSWDHAKNHKAANNHEVIDHVKSFAADNTRVLNASGPNADSQGDKNQAARLNIDSKILKSPAMTKDWDTSTMVASNDEDARQALIRANKADRAKKSALNTAHLK